MEMKRITFFLMTQKGLIVLERFIKEFDSLHIDCVVGARDQNVTNDYYEEIKQVCLLNQIKYLDKSEFKSADTEYSIAVSWRWILYNVKNLIILHDSLLPKYRGFAPLVTSLIKGDTKIGVTAIFANEEFDTGNIIAQKHSEIQYPIKIKEAISKISTNYSEIVNGVAKSIIAGVKIKGVPQNEKEATYSLWRDDNDYKIDWALDSETIKRFVDAVSEPYLGAFTFLGGKTVRVLECEIIDDVVIENRTPGKVIFLKEKLPVIVCGRGLIKLVNAVYDDGTSILPLEKFRSIFM